MPNGSSTPPEPLTPDSAPIPVNAPREGLPPLLNTTHDIAKAAESLSAGVGILALDTERASGFTYSQRADLQGVVLLRLSWNMLLNRPLHADIQVCG